MLITGTNDQSCIDFIIQRFKFHYDLSGYKQSELLPGVSGFLESLLSSSFPVYIATNKRLKPTIKILDHLKISHYFKDLFAVDSCPNGYMSKSEMLKALIAHHSLGNYAIYIGDRYDDYSAATDNTLPFLFPLRGYDLDWHLFPQGTKSVDYISPTRAIDLLSDLILFKSV